MVRHIILLSYREGFSPEENRRNAEKVKAQFAEMKNLVPGIIEFEVIIDPLPTSNKDVIFNSLFESVEALADYQVHPNHVRVAAFVTSVMQERICFDYYE